ncbi:unnamed protein product, partial [Staurois parvus]
VASAVNHRAQLVISRQHLVIANGGRDLRINNTDFSPVSSCTLLYMALRSSVLTVKNSTQ